MTNSTESTVAVLRIELKDIEPLIWRRVAVPTSMNLKTIHNVIQAAMGWLDIHLWEFTANERKFGMRIPEGAPAHTFPVGYTFGELAVNGDPVLVRGYAEQSLRGLGTDHIDLYYPHFPDPSVPLSRVVRGSRSAHPVSRCADGPCSATWAAVHRPQSPQQRFPHEAHSDLSRSGSTDEIERLRQLRSTHRPAD